ncbi:MAG: DEAD/DEAH box helicase [Elusimicrobia bacterium]|nr:DEAD/DEAH box helicase [Elusimicrobiota bacterium]
MKTVLLTGSMSRAERTAALKKIRAGDVDIVVGTHAILNEEVQFRELGLAVIDEQHRFGVRQRERLMTKSVGRAGLGEEALIEKLQPDVLIMTATPIPRTLALTLYGDLDVSVIDEMPAGRSPIRTFMTSDAAAMERIEAALAKGRQVYVVFPIIEESERLAKKGKTVQAATQEFDRLAKRFPNARLGLLHGAMPAEEKRTAMEKFRSGETQVLVATPVIEVGIDVPNATVIVIVNPERFGLAQLHQLRGRVGRGAHASECVLVADLEAETGPNPRLNIFCTLSDGFSLAEEDLRLRGPGEILGEAQHGVPLFRVGDLLKDAILISQAREAARSLVDGELTLTLKEHGILNRALMRRFGSKIQLSRVG